MPVLPTSWPDSGVTERGSGGVAEGGCRLANLPIYTYIIIMINVILKGLPNGVRLIEDLNYGLQSFLFVVFSSSAIVTLNPPTLGFEVLLLHTS